MKRIGLDGTAIGLVMAASLGISLVTPPIWGYVADRSGRRDAVMLWAGLLGSAAIASAVVLPGSAGFVAGFLLFVFARTPVGPLLDSLAISHPDIGPARYGHVRRWGSIGFIAAVAAAGPFVQTLPPRAIPALVAVGWLALTGLLFVVRVPPTARTPGSGLPLEELYASPAIWAFLLVSALHAACGIPFETYFSSYATDLGLPGSWIGAAWAAGVGLEVAVLTSMGALIDRWGPRRILLVAYWAGVLRWALTALVSGGPLLAAVQLLHGLTFGACLGASVVWMSRVVPPALTSSAQSSFAAVAWGFGGILGQLLCGPAYDRLGGRALFAAAAVCELVPLAVLWRLREPPAREP
ncbi:MAG: MFS transporter [Candidatus Wallbacteria bacterium]|nr:MFS transporter [Candidatus Wallbacteria bacterium]